MLYENLQLYLPEKVVKFCNEDQPFFTPELKSIDRKRKREFHKNRRSNKYILLNRKFKQKCRKAKKSFYKNFVEDLKVSQPRQWYSKIKGLTKYNPHATEVVQCEEIENFDDDTQAELIADVYQGVANEYEPLLDTDVCLPTIQEGDYPIISQQTVLNYLAHIKTNTATVLNDIPAKVIKKFAKQLSYPLTNIINTQIRRGEFPNIWKIEQVTPIPKVYPLNKIKQLRKISIFKNFGKISEKIISDLVIEDLRINLEKSQYGNQKGISINHYLVNLINKILMTLDTNNPEESYAIILNLYDWKKAFDMQCPKLGLKSFIKNGVRPSLLPVLRIFFYRIVK